MDKPELSPRHWQRIAHVLSGGGAKGAFQFGAIKYIEEVYKKKKPEFDYLLTNGKLYDILKLLWK